MEGITYVPQNPEADSPIEKSVKVVDVTPEVMVPEPQPQNQQGPRPAPLENHRRTNSFNLFEGTSWGDK